MLSHLILQLESIDGPEKVRRHLSIRGGAHVTSVSHSPESVYSHLALQTLLYYYLTIIQGSTGIWASRTSRTSGYFTAFDTVLNLASSLSRTYKRSSLDALVGHPLCPLHHSHYPQQRKPHLVLRSRSFTLSLLCGRTFPEPSYHKRCLGGSR